MAIRQRSPPSAVQPPDVPSDPGISGALGIYLRSFALWCREGFNAQMRNDDALPGVLLRGYDTPAGENPNVWMLEASGSGTLALAPVALGTGKVGDPVPIAAAADLAGYLPLAGGGTVSGDVSADYFISNGGVFYTDAPNSVSNCHIWFRDQTSATKAIIYWEYSANQLVIQHQDSGASISISVDGSCHLPYDVYAGYGYNCRQGMSGARGPNRFNAFYNGGDGTTQWWIDGTYMGNFYGISDYRTKKDIQLLGSTWDRIKALKPISYTHKDYTPSTAHIEKGKDAPDPLVVASDKERWGFIAHELQETLIEDAATGVKDQADCIQSPNPWTVIAALTKTVQELQARVEELEAR